MAKSQSLSNVGVTDIAVADLPELEGVIATGLLSFVQVGEALKRIRDEKMYAENFDTFEAYLQDRWNISRKRGYDMIAGAQVVETLSPRGDKTDDGETTIVPVTEGVARQLAPLRDEPERMTEVWQTAVDKYGENPTVQQVRVIVQEGTPAPKRTRRSRPQQLAAIEQHINEAQRDLHKLTARNASLDGDLVAGLRVAFDALGDEISAAEANVEADLAAVAAEDNGSSFE